MKPKKNLHTVWYERHDYVRWQMPIPRWLRDVMKAKAAADGVPLHKLNARLLAEGVAREAEG